MKKFRLIAGVIAMAFFAFSCNNDPEVPRGEFESGILFWNEGAFGANDGEVYHFDPTTAEVQSNLFERTNSRPFAGLIQEIVASEDKFYLVANTGKVEVVNASTFVSLGAVSEGLDISRSAVVANGKLYISDWGPYNASFQNPNSYVAVVNQTTGGTISKKIPVSSRPEGMWIVGDRLLVACAGAAKLEVISLAQETVVGSIEIQGNPVRFFEHSGALYLFSRNAQQVFLNRINTSTFTISNATAIPLPASTSRFALGESNDLYVITSSGWPSYNDAIAKLAINTGQVVQTSMYSGSGFYGIGFDPARKRIYVGDNNGFQGNGTVFVLDSNGQEVQTLEAGRGPAGFIFR
jgi:DNA-binding beta-propeller fold protein YncE